PIQSTLLQETGIKRTPNAWGVCKDYSPNGMNELKAIRDELDGLVPGGYFSEDEMKFQGDDTVVQWKAGKSPDKLGAAVESLMDHVIQKCYTAIGRAGGDPDAILGAIIDCCRG